MSTSLRQYVSNDSLFPEDDFTSSMPASGASVPCDGDIAAYKALERAQQEGERDAWRAFLVRRRDSIQDLYSLYGKPAVLNTWDEALESYVEYPGEYRCWGYFKKALKELYDEDKQLLMERERDEEKKRTKYAWTFTTNLMPNQIQEDMCYAVLRLMTQKTNPVRQGYAYLEYTHEGRPHIHGWYETESGGRIYAKTFKRCWQYWGETKGQKGFPGGYHDVMKSRQYDNYAADEGRLIFKKEIYGEYIFNADQAKKFPPPTTQEEGNA